MKLYTHEEMLNKTIGEHGTAERANYDARMNAFLMKEIKKQIKEKSFYKDAYWTARRIMN